MKKLLKILTCGVFAILCCFSLVACGGGEDNVSLIEYEKSIRTEYFTSETQFDLDGASIYVEYESGKREFVDVTYDMLSAFDNTEGEHTYQLTYSGFTQSFTYTVRQARITSISINTDMKKEYLTSDSAFEIGNGKINVYYEDGRTEVVAINTTMLGAFDNSVGEHNVLISCAGKTTYFTYNVKAENIAEVESIELSADAVETRYYSLESSFKIKENAKIIVHLKNGGVDERTLFLSHLSAFDNTVGTHTCTVNYDNHTTTFTYEVVAGFRILQETQNGSLTISQEMATTNEIIKLSPSAADENAYIIDKLAYITGKYENGVFTADDGAVETKIYNLKLTMPASDIKIIVAYKLREQLAEVQAANIDVNNWFDDNMAITYVQVGVNDKTFKTTVDALELNPANQTGILSWNITDQLNIGGEQFVLKNFQIYYWNAGGYFTWENTAVHERNSGIVVGKNDFNHSQAGYFSLTKIGENEYTCNLEVSKPFSVKELAIDTIVDVDMIFNINLIFKVQNTHSVTFITENEQLDTQYLYEGTKLTNPTSDVWYTDEACTEVYDFNSAVKADLVLYKK